MNAASAHSPIAIATVYIYLPIFIIGIVKEYSRLQLSSQHWSMLHNIIETFTVFTLLLENLCMLQSIWQLSIILQWQAMCIMLIVAQKCRCWTSFTGFAHRFLSKSLNVTAFSTLAMTMQKCSMCQSFLCHRLSEPSLEPTLKFVKMNLYTIQWFL